ncbi:p protein [Trichonephila inaurata madagascariensis]|uniref:P protein n=1 Tax=Trichonephila inaurata madagascariensis TaxID=2747483 RepID=A0A8X6IJC8_9ARAC|nr:p protein [Trichonephila inaurata madagascariensis]
MSVCSEQDMNNLTNRKDYERSENTPLLNGHQDTPYVYAFTNRVDEELVNSSSSVQSTNEMSNKRPKGHKGILRTIKLILLSFVVIFCVVSLSFLKVYDNKWNTITISRKKPFYINVTGDIIFDKETINLRAKGPFLSGEYYNVAQDFVSFKVAKVLRNGTYVPVSKEWKLLLTSNTRDFEIDTKVLEHDFSLEPDEMSDSKTYEVTISTNKKRDYVSMCIDVSVRPKLAIGHIVMALFVLIGLYILIIFELVHQTLAAMIGATVAVSCLALVGERPSSMEILTWMDVETLKLLFGMMVLVSILSETGFFHYIAVQTYRMARGQIWTLVTSLCLVTAVLSAFLDNVTTILLMSAVAIKLCETMNIDPRRMLIAMVVFSNIGGAMTPIGDPPNIIIINNRKVKIAGIGFIDFTMHMAPAVILCIAATYIFLRLMYRDISSLRLSDPPEVIVSKHEIDVWKTALNSLTGYSKEDDTARAEVHRKITLLETSMKKKIDSTKISEEEFRASLLELTNAFRVKDASLLIKSGIVISVVIIFFFIGSIPGLNLSIGWIAILGAIFLLVLGDFEELESILSRVEWSTLLFFGGLFVVMEALKRLHLVWYVVNMTQNAINSVDESNRLLVAIALVLWISALSSSFIDNIPFTTVMVQVVTDLADNQDMKLPIKPLIYALALGACLGGNGTLIGASANVVTAGIAEQHGYRFSFYDFFRVGFPITILTTTISTAYLFFCHLWIGWNE